MPETPFTILDGTYQLVSMTTRVLQEVAFYDVLKQFTLHPTFFSFIQSDDMVSIVVDEIHPMPIDRMYTVVTGYKALVLDDSLQASDVLYEFLVPIYEAQIDIVQINMIHSIVLLMPKDDLPRAQLILERARNASFADTDSLNSETSNQQQVLSMVDLSTISTNITICTLTISELERFTNGIIQSFFYQKPAVVWQSFSIVHDKVILILDEKENRKFDINTLIMSNWTVLRVSKGVVPVTASLVWKTMEVLQGIHVRYMCMESVAGDFLLLETNMVDHVAQHLKQTALITLT